MTLIDRQSICDALRELSDVEAQQRLWLSDGSGGSDVSSFVEAVEQLFTDTGLADALRTGATGLGTKADTILNSLERTLRNVDVSHGPRRTIDDPSMADVRSMAGDLLAMLSNEA